MRPPDEHGSPLERDDVHELIAELGSRPVPTGRLGRAQARGLAWAERITTWGPTRPVAEIGWRVYRRDQAVAGSVMAAAIAYRMFIWMLPLALLLVAGLGLYAEARDESALETTEDSLSGFFAESVAAAADTTGTWTRIVLLVSGLVVFLYQSYVLLRTLRAVSAFSWGIPVRPMRGAPIATLTFLALLLMAVLTSSAIKPISDALLPPLGWLLALAALLVIPTFYVLANVLVMPHAAPRWTDLVPGALLFYAAVAALSLVNQLILFPWLARREETYGVLGVAAGILFSLFIVGRSFELASSLNAVLVEKRERLRGEALRHPDEARFTDGALAPDPDPQGPPGRA
jgi:uncharacterized BrkB/YihY/UPF0761 family membrane protein